MKYNLANLLNGSKVRIAFICKSYVDVRLNDFKSGTIFQSDEMRKEVLKNLEDILMAELRLLRPSMTQEDFEDYFKFLVERHELMIFLQDV